MNSEVPIRLVLVDPPSAIDYGVQGGRGAQYETVLVRQRKRRDVSFDFSLTVADNRKDGLPNFLGPFAQGPPTKRFVYIDVGRDGGPNCATVQLLGDWQVVKDRRG